MKADKDLDKLIAEKIFGWTHEESDLLLNGFHPWSPSTDIELAWQVVEKLRNTNRVFCLASVVEHMGKKSALMWVAKWEMHDPEYRMEFALSADAPTAICLASLKAIG